MTAESYCMESAEQLFAARGPTDEEYWRGAGQPDLTQRKMYVKQVIHQLFEVRGLRRGWRNTGRSFVHILCLVSPCLCVLKFAG